MAAASNERSVGARKVETKIDIHIIIYCLLVSENVSTDRAPTNRVLLLLFGWIKEFENSGRENPFSVEPVVLW